MNPLLDRLFPFYAYADDRGCLLRLNIYTREVSGYCRDLRKWCDLDYLGGTNYDNGRWAVWPMIKWPTYWFIRNGEVA